MSQPNPWSRRSKLQETMANQAILERLFNTIFLMLTDYTDKHVIWEKQVKLWEA